LACRGLCADGRLAADQLARDLGQPATGAADLKIDYVFLINDLQPTDTGIAELERSDLYPGRSDAQQIGNSRADFRGHRPGRSVHDLGWTRLRSLPIRRRTRIVAPRNEDEIDLLWAVSKAEVQRPNQL